MRASAYGRGANGRSVRVAGHSRVTSSRAHPRARHSPADATPPRVALYSVHTVPPDDRVAGSPAPRKVRAPWTRCQVTPGHAARRDGQCHREQTAFAKAEVRVKRWGKSPPRP